MNDTIKFVSKQDTINLATQFGDYLYNRLPKVYRDYDVEIERFNVETQKKETFKTLKEYLYSFALGGFQPLLEDLEAIINLVDPFKCPSQFLPYLLRHFGLDYIDDIPEKFQRRLVQNVVTLYKKKGTIPAVAFLAKELSGFGVNIEEKSDGSIEFALIKLNAYENEDAELLLAQDVIQRYIHLFLPSQTKSKVIVVYGFTESIHINSPEVRLSFVADNVDHIDISMKSKKDLSGVFLYYITDEYDDWSEERVISYSDIAQSSDFTTLKIPVDNKITGNVNSLKLVFVNNENISDNEVQIQHIKFLDDNSSPVFEINMSNNKFVTLYAGDNTKTSVSDGGLSIMYTGIRGYVYNQLGNTKYDHVYYNVDEYEDITYVSDNGHGEAFDYLNNTVEEYFNSIKMQLEEDSQNFNPSLLDLTSFTNAVHNDGLPVFTNGINCEDTIITQSVESDTGEVTVDIPDSSSTISVNKLVGSGDSVVLPIYKCEIDLYKDTTLEFIYDGKSYGYYTLERDLYASSNFPTTFQLDIYNDMVKVYNQYFTETIDGSYDFELYSGYGSYHTTMRNGFVATDFVSEIRVECDYSTEFIKMDSLYFQPTTTPRIAFHQHDVYISLSDIISSAESAKEFVKEHPITLISPSAKIGTGTNAYTSLCGQTIAYKKLSDTPVNNVTKINCTVYTMDDRKTVFAYESPVFIQDSNITIGGDFGLRVFPEKEVSGEEIKITDHLKEVPLIDYKIYGNSVQKTRSGKNLFDKSKSTLNSIQNETVGSYWGSPIMDNKNTIQIFQPNTTYTVSFDVECIELPTGENITLFAKNLGLALFSSGNSIYPMYINIQIEQGQIYHIEKTITTNSNIHDNGTNYQIIAYGNRYVDENNKGVLPRVIFRNIQVEIGSTATEYEPYGLMPSPEFPSEVQSVGEKTVNLFDVSNFVDFYSPYMRTALEYGYHAEVNEECLKIYGGIDADGRALFYMDGSFKENTVYTIYFDCYDVLVDNAAGIYICLSYTDGTKDIVNNSRKDRVWKHFSVNSNSSKTVKGITLTSGTGSAYSYLKNIQIEEGNTATPYEPYGYKVPVVVRGKNLLPNANWLSGIFSAGFNETPNVDYITEYTQNSISFNLTAWKGVSSPRFPKDSVKRIVFKINQNQINSDEYINFYINIQGYDDENNNVGSQLIYNNAVADAEYVIDINTLKGYAFFKNSTQFSFCILNRGNAIDNLKVYDIAYYSDTDTTEYEPYQLLQENIYIDEPLRAQYQKKEKRWYYDTIDYKSGVLTRNLSKITFDGSADEKWRFSKETDSKIHFYIGDISNNCSFGSTLDSAMCDKFVGSYTNATTSNSLEGFSVAYTTNMAYIGIFKSRLTDAGLTVDLNGFKTWLSQNPITITYILKTPTEETISLPEIKALSSDNMTISVPTSIPPSAIDITYYQNKSVPQDSEITYDLGIPLVSFDGYNESIEKIDGKYYLRSAIKELDLDYMYDNLGYGTNTGSDGYLSVNWFNIIISSKDVHSHDNTPFYFNMSPCKYDVESFDPSYRDLGTGEVIVLPNRSDVFDFVCFIYDDMISISLITGESERLVQVNQFGFLSGNSLKAGLDTFKQIYDNLFRYSDIPPKFYIYDKYNKYGGETLTEITDKDVINKLNLLPIPDNCAIISSKGIKYSHMDISVQSKKYY